MLGQVVLVYEEVVVSVQLPELAVDHVEMFVTEVLRNLINVLLILQVINYLQNNAHIFTKLLAKQTGHNMHEFLTNNAARA